MAEPGAADEPAENLGARAFAVFASWLAAEVAEENSELEAENALLKPLHDRIKSVEIRVDDRVVALPGLDTAETKGRGTLATISISVGRDGPILPLDSYGHRGNAKVYISKQLVTRFPGSIHPHLNGFYEDGSLGILMHDTSGKVCIRGRVNNLSREDMASLQNESSGGTKCPMLGRFLQEGVGMNSPDATFAPDLIFLLQNFRSKSPGIHRNVLLAQRPLLYHMEEVLQSSEGELENTETSLKMARGEYNTVEYSLKQLTGQSIPNIETLEHSLKLAKKTLIEAEAKKAHLMAITKESRQLKDKLDAHFATTFPETFPENTENIGISSADELCELAFAVNVKPKHTELLRQSRRLRLEGKNLVNVKSRIGSIELYYGDRHLGASLEDGFSKTHGDLGDVWCIPIPPASRTTHIIEANKLTSLEVFVSGVYSRRVSGGIGGAPHPDVPLSVPFEIEHDSGLCLSAAFRFGSGRSLLEAVGTGALANAMQTVVNGWFTPLGLPADCVVVPISVHFRLDSITDTLKIIGCSRGLQAPE